MSIAASPEQPNLNRRVGRAVAAALKARGATGKELCVVLGLSKAQVSARLNGHTPFRADELLAVGEHLDVDPGQFLSDSPVFPLSAEVDLSVIPGEGGILGQGLLPFRPVLTLHR